MEKYCMWIIVNFYKVWTVEADLQAESSMRALAEWPARSASSARCAVCTMAQPIWKTDTNAE